LEKVEKYAMNNSTVYTFQIIFFVSLHQEGELGHVACTKEMRNMPTYIFMGRKPQRQRLYMGLNVDRRIILKLT
jgi:hypothetical protein